MKSTDLATPEYLSRISGKRARLASNDGGPADSMTGQMLSAIFENLGETATVDKGLAHYLPWTSQSAEMFVAEHGHHGFNGKVQHSLNLACSSVKTVALEGLHGVGKTELTKEISHEINTPLVKLSGFISPAEFDTYGIRDEAKDLFGKELDHLSQTREGETQWHLLQRVYFHQLNEALRAGKRVIIGDRGPITRLLNWQRDPKKVFVADPFMTEYQLPELNFDRFQNVRGIKAADFWVQVPLPFTIFLFHDDIGTKSLEGHRQESNRRNFWDFQGLAWDMHDVLGELGVMEYIDISRKTYSQTKKEVMEILKKKNII